MTYNPTPAELLDHVATLFKSPAGYVVATCPAMAADTVKEIRDAAAKIATDIPKTVVLVCDDWAPTAREAHAPRNAGEAFAVEALAVIVRNAGVPAGEVLKELTRLAREVRDRPGRLRRRHVPGYGRFIVQKGRE